MIHPARLVCGSAITSTLLLLAGTGAEGVAGALPASAVTAPKIAQDDLLLVSRASDGGGGAAGDHSSGHASTSEDGHLVVFESDADNLSTLDNNIYSGIFLRDTRTNQTTLVSVASLDGGGNNAANGGSSDPTITPDGRYIAFESSATNFGHLEGYTKIFVRDTVAQTTTLASRQSAAEGGAPGNDHSFGSAISADGRFVAFCSDADNLSSEDDNDVTNVFVRDLLTNTTVLVSRATGAAGAPALGAPFDYGYPAISADGRYVGFASKADNLSAADSDNTEDVFVRDLLTNTTTLVSRANGAGGSGADATSYAPSLSSDGRYVAFTSYANNLSPADGDIKADVYLRDLASGTTTLLSRASAAGGGAKADVGSFAPSVSADGRYVAFESVGDTLSSADDHHADVYVRDTITDTTILVSRQSGVSGVEGDGESYQASISADGRAVAFTSTADNLSSIASGGTGQVYLRQVLAALDTVPPVLSVRSHKHARLGRPLRLKVGCDESCSVLATATAGFKSGGKRRTVSFKPVRASIGPGGQVRLRLKLARKARQRLADVMRTKVKLKVTATDPAGNAAVVVRKVALRGT